MIGSLVVLLAVFALVASNVAANHSPKPHGLPIGIVGTPAVASVIRRELARADPGAFEFHAYRSLTSARTAVLHRSVYGAFQPAPAPVLLVASAASLSVAVLLRKTFSVAARRLGRALAVRDLVPLVIGNPASGGSSAPELLPGFWRTLSQLLPPGAGVTSLRDVVYFNGHGSAHALIVLAVYAGLGGTVAMITRGLRTRPAAATAAG